MKKTYPWELEEMTKLQLKCTIRPVVKVTLSLDDKVQSKEPYILPPEKRNDNFSFCCNPILCFYLCLNNILFDDQANGKLTNV